MFFGTVEKPPRLSEFDLEIPEELIADNPSKQRDNAKLMVLNRKDMTIEHKKFKDIVDYFKKGEVLVLNNKKVYPARLFAKKDKSDAKVEVFLLRELANNLWEAMVKPARKVRIGNKLILSDDITCDVIDNTVSGGRVLRFDYDQQALYSFIDKNTEPLVFIHGVGLNHKMWDSQINSLNDYSLITYDLLGHGRTPYNKAEVTLSDFSNQLNHLLQFLKIDRIS